MENFEINSNESQKLDEDKQKPEVNNNRSINNNKYTYEKIELEINTNKNSESQEGTLTKTGTEESRNGHLNEVNMDLGVEMRKSDCLNGEYYRLDAGPSLEATVDDDTQNSSSHSDDNGELVEEIILLPSNFISDDELSSNSDDCIYAYRGGHINNVEGNMVLEPVNLVNDGQDEETDFLEMDFDPEPNSEIENFMEDEHHFNHLEANFFSLRIDEGLRELPSVSQLRQNGSGSPLDTFQNNTDEQQILPAENQVTQNPSKSKELVYTGAKPKLVTSHSAHKLSSSSSYSKDQYETDSNRPESSFKPSSAPLTTSNIDDQLSCLECAEDEFICQTKPEFSFERQCRRHCSKVVPSLSYSSPPSESCLSSQPPSLPVPFKSSSSTTTTINRNSSQPISGYNKEFMVTIYSINCDYETIVEATNLIKVTINTEILQHYFDNLADEETATMSVPEYLLYVSKRNCNYKRLIDVIKAACLDAVDIHFYPVRIFL